MRLHPAALLLAITACGTGPVLLTPSPLGSFSLADSTAVIRRVEQVFACPAVTVAISTGTLGWRRDIASVDLTIEQEYFPAGSADGPRRTCWKGFRVDAEGRIFALPEKDWPYTKFRKKGAGTLPAARRRRARSGLSRRRDRRSPQA